MNPWVKTTISVVVCSALLGIGWRLGWVTNAGIILPIVFGAVITVVLTLRQRKERGDDWAMRRGKRSLLFLGVFFAFATLGPIIVFATIKDKTPGMGLVAAVYSGAIAAGWSAISVYRAWWLIAVLVTVQIVLTDQVFEVANSAGLLQIGRGLSERSRLLILAGEAAVCMSVGYVYTLRFVRGVTRLAAIAGAELEMARSIHERIVPPVEKDFGIAQVYGKSHPSSEMGGDLLDVTVRDGVLDVYLADVSGHGVKAGLVMGMVKSAIRMRQRSTPSLDVMVSDLNAVLADLMMADMFATLACVRISKVAGNVQAEYALAGHWPILHVSAQGQLTELPNEHLPLGVDTEELFLSGVVGLRSGDLLVLMTDGLIEVQNSGGKELGFGVFKDLITRERAMPLAELHDAVLNLARQHGQQLDDQSLVLIRVP
jgi:hypothetical protein